MKPPTDTLERRLARLESRLVQLMLYLGADPTVRYGPPNPSPPAAIVRRVREPKVS